MVVYGQFGFIRGKCGSIRAKVVAFEESGCFRAK